VRIKQSEGLVSETVKTDEVLLSIAAWLCRRSSWSVTDIFTALHWSVDIADYKAKYGVKSSLHMRKLFFEPCHMDPRDGLGSESVT
jgi:hypothetical protein